MDYDTWLEAPYQQHCEDYDYRMNERQWREDKAQMFVDIESPETVLALYNDIAGGDDADVDMRDLLVKIALGGYSKKSAEELVRGVIVDALVKNFEKWA
jgi:hypothetical protein